jgi:hypothetical protein
MPALPATEVAAGRLKPAVGLRRLEREYSVHEGGRLAEGLTAATSVAGKSLEI